MSNIKWFIMDLITKRNEMVVGFLQSLDRLLEQVECLVDNCKPLLGGERYLTDCEVSKVLRVSRRTLQDYRNQGRIDYIVLGGKMLYRESDIQRLLERNYFKAFNNEE